MVHQNGRKKLNLKPPHRRAMLRNQVIHLITYGHLVSTKARVKEVQRLAEKIVTIARKGNDFNSRRRVHAWAGRLLLLRHRCGGRGGRRARGGRPP